MVSVIRVCTELCLCLGEDVVQVAKDIHCCGSASIFSLY